MLSYSFESQGWNCFVGLSLRIIQKWKLVSIVTDAKVAKTLTLTGFSTGPLHRIQQMICEIVYSYQSSKPEAMVLLFKIQGSVHFFLNIIKGVLTITRKSGLELFCWAQSHDQPDQTLTCSGCLGQPDIFHKFEGHLTLSPKGCRANLGKFFYLRITCLKFFHRPPTFESVTIDTKITKRTEQRN